MFADIRKFMDLSNDCSILTKFKNDTTPIDLEEKTNNNSNSNPNYFQDPHICLSELLI